MDRLRPILMACLVAVSATPLAAQRGPAPMRLHADPKDLALACAPSLAGEPSATRLRVTGGQDTLKRTSHAPGDLVTINAGSDNGMVIGQEYFARRIQADRGVATRRRSPEVIRTTGWLRIWAVDPKMSLATVTHACETIDVGDYLEPFAMPHMPAVSQEPLTAEKDNYGHVTIGVDRRRAFAKGDFFILDRGSAHGVAPGSRFVVFRDRLQPSNFLYDLGEAVAVDVKEHSATLQVVTSRDALLVGDFVAMRR